MAPVSGSGWPDSYDFIYLPKMSQMKRKRRPIQMLAEELSVDVRTIVEAGQRLELISSNSPMTTFTVSECTAIAECVQADKLADWASQFDFTGTCPAPPLTSRETIVSRPLNRAIRSHRTTSRESFDNAQPVVEPETLEIAPVIYKADPVRLKDAMLLLEQHSLEATDEMLTILSGGYAPELKGLVYTLDPSGSDVDDSYDLLWAIEVLQTAVHPPPPDLIPLMPVDERSFACVVCGQRGCEQPSDFNSVVRWHLDEVPVRVQRQLLDVSPNHYLNTIAEDLKARERGIKDMETIVAKYDENQKGRPRHWHKRPIRLAVQNVVIGHAAVKHDDITNSLACSVWQTCQVPHVAAHEGTRALAALTLGQAFSYGGTMEIRFDQHAEGRVPAVLRQFARTRHFELGKIDSQAIHPREARKLMWAVTEMPDELQHRLEAFIKLGHLSPERACFILLSGVWTPIELDFLAATSARLPSILRGDTYPLDRMARQAELTVCRAAHMIGIMFKVFQTGETQASNVVAVQEDRRDAVSWTVLPDEGVVRFKGVRGRRLPDLHNCGELINADQLLVVPRHTAADCNQSAMRRLASKDEAIAFLTPFGDPADSDDILSVQCPDTLEAIDRAIDFRLLKSIVGRS